ncbi:NAD(P)-dependent oxidoreductase [Sulfurospirillum diekertiae]
MPLLFSLEGKKVLLIGAGAIGQRKLEKLLNYTSSITIMTKECSHSMEKNHT